MQVNHEISGYLQINNRVSNTTSQKSKTHTNKLVIINSENISTVVKWYF